MTEEQLEGFKELAESIQQNTQQAYEIYKEEVDRIDKDNVQNVNEIERQLDYLLTYCADEKILLLFKKLCRHYFKIDPVATAEYVAIYRNMWEEDNQK